MITTPTIRKLALIMHIVTSVGWIGAIVAYPALGLSTVISDDTRTIRGAWIGMEMTGWFALVPQVTAALVTGLVMSLSTRWGLFRHYWVVISLVLTILSVVVLVLHMPIVSYLADVAQTTNSANLTSLGGDLFHPGIGLLVLLIITGLNVYKLRGMTRYGWRKLHEPRTGSQP